MKGKLGFSTDCLITRETQNSDSLNEECTLHLKLLKAKRILKNKLKKDLKENSNKPGKKPLKFVKVMIKECYYLKDISTRQCTNHEGMDLQTSGANSFP